MIDWNSLIDEALVFIPIFARVATLLRIAPILSSSAIPPLARGGLAFFSSVIFMPFVSPMYGSLSGLGAGYAVVVLGEIMLGILMGLFLQIIFAVFQTAGQFFSFQMGFGASQVFDPMAQIEIPLIGQFLNLVGIGVFLSVAGVPRLFILALGRSFEIMKGTDLLSAGEFLETSMIASIGRLFEQALLLSLPMLGMLVLVSISMGLLARAAPQMNLLVIGFPIQIGVGFIVLLTASPFLVEKMSALIEMGFGMIQSYFVSVRDSLR